MDTEIPKEMTTELNEVSPHFLPPSERAPQSWVGMHLGSFVAFYVMPILEEGFRLVFFILLDSPNPFAFVFGYALIAALLHVVVDVHDYGWRGFFERLPSRFAYSILFGLVSLGFAWAIELKLSNPLILLPGIFLHSDVSRSGFLTQFAKRELTLITQGILTLINPIEEFAQSLQQKDWEQALRELLWKWQGLLPTWVSAPSSPTRNRGQPDKTKHWSFANSSSDGNDSSPRFTLKDVTQADLQRALAGIVGDPELSALSIYTSVINRVKDKRLTHSQLAELIRRADLEAPADQIASWFGLPDEIKKEPQESSELNTGPPIIDENPDYYVGNLEEAWEEPGHQYRWLGDASIFQVRMMFSFQSERISTPPYQQVIRTAKADDHDESPIQFIEVISPQGQRRSFSLTEQQTSNGPEVVAIQIDAIPETAVTVEEKRFERSSLTDDDKIRALRDEKWNRTEENAKNIPDLAKELTEVQLRVSDTYRENQNALFVENGTKANELMLDRYFNDKPITRDDLEEINNALQNKMNVPDQEGMSGVIRGTQHLKPAWIHHGEPNGEGGRFKYFYFLPPDQVPDAVDRLLAEVNSLNPEEHGLADVARLASEYTFTQPFTDANHRESRIAILDFALLKIGLPPLPHYPGLTMGSLYMTTKNFEHNLRKAYQIYQLNQEFPGNGKIIKTGAKDFQSKADVAIKFTDRAFEHGLSEEDANKIVATVSRSYTQDVLASGRALYVQLEGSNVQYQVEAFPLSKMKPVRYDQSPDGFPVAEPLTERAPGGIVQQSTTEAFVDPGGRTKEILLPEQAKGGSGLSASIIEHDQMWKARTAEPPVPTSVPLGVGLFLGERFYFEPHGEPMGFVVTATIPNEHERFGTLITKELNTRPAATEHQTILQNRWAMFSDQIQGASATLGLLHRAGLTHGNPIFEQFAWNNGSAHLLDYTDSKPHPRTPLNRTQFVFWMIQDFYRFHRDLRILADKIAAETLIQTNAAFREDIQRGVRQMRQLGKTDRDISIAINQAMRRHYGWENYSSSINSLFDVLIDNYFPEDLRNEIGRTRLQQALHFTQPDVFYPSSWLVSRNLINSPDESFLNIDHSLVRIFDEYAGAIWDKYYAQNKAMPRKENGFPWEAYQGLRELNPTQSADVNRKRINALEKLYSFKLAKSFSEVMQEFSIDDFEPSKIIQPKVLEPFQKKKKEISQIQQKLKNLYSAEALLGFSDQRFQGIEEHVFAGMHGQDTPDCGVCKITLEALKQTLAIYHPSIEINEMSFGVDLDSNHFLLQLTVPEKGNFVFDIASGQIFSKVSNEFKIEKILDSPSSQHTNYPDKVATVLHQRNNTIGTEGQIYWTSIYEGRKKFAEQKKEIAKLPATSPSPDWEEDISGLVNQVTEFHATPTDAELVRLGDPVDEAIRRLDPQPAISASWIDNFWWKVILAMILEPAAAFAGGEMAGALAVFAVFVAPHANRGWAYFRNRHVWILGVGYAVNFVFFDMGHTGLGVVLFAALTVYHTYINWKEAGLTEKIGKGLKTLSAQINAALQGTPLQNPLDGLDGVENDLPGSAPAPTENTQDQTDWLRREGIKSLNNRFRTETSVRRNA